MIIKIREEYDIVVARVEAKDMAKQIGFDIVDQTRIATAISELARNIIEHGGGEGVILINQIKKKDEECDEIDDEGSGRTGLEIVAMDRGPGIDDIEKAMEDGYSSGGGLGIGLGAVKRLMDEFEVWSKVGEGTRVRVVKWIRS
ncbi:ATP-binding protein [Methanosarcinales archaeon]|nr:MAG: ATP-binding protein [Methanosarcinales archaeon]